MNGAGYYLMGIPIDAATGNPESAAFAAGAPIQQRFSSPPTNDFDNRLPGKSANLAELGLAGAGGFLCQSAHFHRHRGRQRRSYIHQPIASMAARSRSTIPKAIRSTCRSVGPKRPARPPAARGNCSIRPIRMRPARKSPGRTPARRSRSIRTANCRRHSSNLTLAESHRQRRHRRQCSVQLRHQRA